MKLDIPASRDLVLVGGGHSHALLLRMWGMQPLAGARVTLINPHPVAEYSGMLPGFVAGLYDRDLLTIDLVKLARHAGARLILDRATGLDTASGQVQLAGRGPVAYDIASLDVGVATIPPDLPGFAQHALPLKPTSQFVERWQDFAASGGGRIVIIGGGLAGVEIALAARRRLPHAPVTVIEADATPLRELSTPARRHVLVRAAAARIDLICGSPVTEISARSVQLADGRTLPAQLIVGAAGGWTPDWLGATGLRMQGDRILVDDRLATSDGQVFATGDCAILSDAPRPQAGVFAVRQAPVLAANLRAALTGRGRQRRFRPQRDWLRLIAAGGDAVADKWGLGVGGGWVWHWKDRIDRRFMAMLHDLPKMPPPALPRQMALGARDAMGDKPLCGGCGAKMGRAALQRVLLAQASPRRHDILTGPGDDAAVIQMGDLRQVLTTDHLRAFVLDPALMARIAALHALGDIRAMGAQPQSALIQVTLPRLSEPLQERTLTEIMDAAAQVLDAAGAPIVGGHSSTGAEMTIGFSLTGTARDPIGQTARPGDVLILTKPIGTGVVLAAEMIGAAPGRAVAAAWDWMSRDQAHAARILGQDPSDLRARAMTDLTGFGLAGHLAGIAEASGARITIALDRLPLIDGAETLSAAGHHSSLYAANRSATLGLVQVPATARGRLVFDPQTSGGLIAALPAARAEAALAAIHAAGDDAWIVGEVGHGPAEVLFRQHEPD
ncbi:selenide, water dikinase SelD [Paracoccus salsus]|uniref:selenide, water dikinase SelD n=1 Tax=Paracoccus salsus TaxID=2911061 RepID=UPI001F257F40|nr:selenide, water dikinase SelD [Paracoccus salsus]MCF3972700.1 selenide, water dikinase SelD [Paracoccus salsus]